MSDKCELCGEPMPTGETMFKFHGFSGPCPKPQLANKRMETNLLETTAHDGFVDGIRFVQRIPEKLTRQQALRLAGEIAAALDPNFKEIRLVVADRMEQTRRKVHGV